MNRHTKLFQKNGVGFSLSLKNYAIRNYDKYAQVKFLSALSKMMTLEAASDTDVVEKIGEAFSYDDMLHLVYFSALNAQKQNHNINNHIGTFDEFVDMLDENNIGFTEIISIFMMCFETLDFESMKEVAKKK